MTSSQHPVDIHPAYTYAEHMPNATDETPKRKSMFLGPEALRNLSATSARRRTEREAMEEALKLLAQRDTQLDAMADFVDWAIAEWGHPTREDHEAADKIWEAAQIQKAGK